MESWEVPRLTEPFRVGLVSKINLRNTVQQNSRHFLPCVSLGDHDAAELSHLHYEHLSESPGCYHSDHSDHSEMSCFPGKARQAQPSHDPRLPTCLRICWDFQGWVIPISSTRKTGCLQSVPAYRHNMSPIGKQPPPNPRSVGILVSTLDAG